MVQKVCSFILLRLGRFRKRQMKWKNAEEQRAQSTQRSLHYSWPFELLPCVGRLGCVQQPAPLHFILCNFLVDNNENERQCDPCATLQSHIDKVIA